MRRDTSRWAARSAPNSPTSEPVSRYCFISGYSCDDLRRRGLVDYDDQFLQKPFAPMDLARKVREVLDRAEEEKVSPRPDRNDAG